ncbi:hypothetical protein [Rhizobium terrae]|uniref:hypothetical protein n=1 Tax=Rhizobium terrae TaxID=2171756 RepID=UPI000E3BDC8E|nr:hypothetical protein [Rhizobium terrae]
MLTRERQQTAIISYVRAFLKSYRGRILEEIIIKAYVSLAACSNEDEKILGEALNACRAFWLAAQALPNYQIEQARPHNRCIYAALAVRDILNKRGIVAAEVYTCGLQIRLFDPNTGQTLKGIAVGNPEGLAGPKHWNAHLVVRAGDFLFDPTLVQASRPWNDLPHVGAFRFGAPEWHHVTMSAGTAKTSAVTVTPVANEQLEIAYFELPSEPGFEKRSYRTSSNSGVKQRRDVVSAALRLLDADSEIKLTEVEARTIDLSVMGLMTTS